MKTIHVIRRKSGNQAGHLAHQRGMGATMILFTIALIVLVGAALAYASRGNPSAINTQTAKVQSAVILKQGADYRDAYNRYTFDGLSQANLTFDTTSTGLFFPTTQYGNYQAPPAQAMNGAAVAQWLFSKTVAVFGIGVTATADTVAYIPDVSLNVCKEINNQLYGTTVVPTSTTLTLATMTAGATPIDTAANAAGRPTGCFATTDTKYIVFTTLGEF